MNARIKVKFSFMLFLLFTGTMFLPLTVYPASIQITYLDSPVKYRGPDDLTWNELNQSDTSIPGQGDLLVGEGGAVGLRDGDTSTIRLNEKTGISLMEGELGDTVRVNHGSSHFDVKEDLPDDSNYRIKTTNASIGIRGTQFGVSYERDDRSEVFVEDGEVAFRSGGDFNTLDTGTFGRTGGPTAGAFGSVSTGETLPERFELTWDHWDVERRVRSIRRRKNELRTRALSLEKKVESGTVSDTESARSRLDELHQKIDSLNSKHEELTNRYDQLSDQYRTYRRELERKRQDFIRRRRQAFDRFRRRRMEEMRKMEEDRRRGIERMQNQREQGFGERAP